jgi:hypothetical protein
VLLRRSNPEPRADYSQVFLKFQGCPLGPCPIPGRANSR